MTMGNQPGGPGGAVKYCSACGAMLDPRAEICPRCGVRQVTPFTMGPGGMTNVNAGFGQRSKVVAGLLGIFLGGLGIHKFYTGKIAQGVLYLVFCWTFIPAIVGFIEGIWYLTMSDQEFWSRYPSR